MRRLEVMEMLKVTRVDEESPRDCGIWVVGYRLWS